MKCLDANMHNHATTTYYIILNTFKRLGKLKCEYEGTQIKESSKTTPLQLVKKEREETK